MARGCFVGLFLQGVAPAGHWNGSRDDGGSLAVGRPLGNGYERAWLMSSNGYKQTIGPALQCAIVAAPPRIASSLEDGSRS